MRQNLDRYTENRLALGLFIGLISLMALSGLVFIILAATSVIQLGTGIAIPILLAIEAALLIGLCCASTMVGFRPPIAPPNNPVASTELAQQENNAPSHTAITIVQTLNESKPSTNNAQIKTSLPETRKRSSSEVTFQRCPDDDKEESNSHHHRPLFIGLPPKNEPQDSPANHVESHSASPKMG